MKLYLIRHGITEGNERHLYYGSTDLPLAPAGISELNELRELWQSTVTGSPRFITSGMLRTRQTLEILFGDRQYSVMPDLREVDFGIFEMKTYEELKEVPEYIEWISGDNFSNIAPGGESGQMVKDRSVAAFEGILATDEDTVVVTHGGVISCLMDHLFHEEGKNFYEWQPKPGYGYVLEGRNSFIAAPFLR